MNWIIITSLASFTMTYLGIVNEVVIRDAEESQIKCEFLLHTDEAEFLNQCDYETTMKRIMNTKRGY